MGLDSYASRSPGDVDLAVGDAEAFLAAGIELCGGIASGDDSSSFRGKVYLDVVERVAGASLMAEWIPPDEIREIAAAFDRCASALVAEESQDDRYPVTPGEVVGLGRFFRVCADRGLGLIGWW